MEPKRSHRLLVVLDQAGQEQNLVTPYVIRELGFTEVEYKQINQARCKPTYWACYEAVLVDARAHDKPQELLGFWKRKVEKEDYSIIVVLSEKYRELQEQWASSSYINLLFTDTPSYLLVKELRQQMAHQVLLQEKKKLEKFNEQSRKRISLELIETINNIQGYSQRLIEQAGGVVAQHDLVRLMRETNYLSHVVKNRLQKHSVSVGEIENCLKTVRLRTLWEDVYESLRMQGKLITSDWNIMLDSYFDQYIAVDTCKLRQALQTLLTIIADYKKDDDITIQVKTNQVNPKEWEKIQEDAWADSVNRKMSIEISLNGQALPKVIADYLGRGNKKAFGENVRNDDASMALLQMTELIHQMGGQITVDSGTEKSTRLLLQLPFDLPDELNSEQLMVNENPRQTKSQSDFWEKIEHPGIQDSMAELMRLNSDLRKSVAEAVIVLDLEKLVELGKQYAEQYPVVGWIANAAESSEYNWLLSLQETILDHESMDELLDKMGLEVFSFHTENSHLQP